MLTGTLVLGVLAVAVVLLDGSLDRSERVQSVEYATPTERLRALRAVVPFDEPAEDVVFDVTTSEGLLTPGPAGVNACIVARVPRASLPRWVEGWRPAPPETALDLSCARRLVGQWPTFHFEAERRDYRRADADEHDASEQRSVFESDAAVVWRIAR